MPVTLMIASVTLLAFGFDSSIAFVGGVCLLPDRSFFVAGPTYLHLFQMKVKHSPVCDIL